MVFVQSTQPLGYHELCLTSESFGSVLGGLFFIVLLGSELKGLFWLWHP